MYISILAFLSAISISIVAAFYSIVGLTAIFPASWLSIIIMGSVLELGKVISAVWLHTFWSRSSYLIRTYLSIAVLILMTITSLGIFGFLSKAHIDHMAGETQYEVSIENIDTQISRQNKIISDNQTVLDQLDSTIKTLIDAQRIRGKDGSIAVRENQKSERQSLTKNIDDATEIIETLTTKKSKIQLDQSKLEAEVGPIKYVAEILYGADPDKSTMEAAVRVLILLIVVVFDPLAVCLIIAAISGINLSRRHFPVISPNIPVHQDSLIQPEQIVNKEEHIENAETELTEEEIAAFRQRSWLGG